MLEDLSIYEQAYYFNNAEIIIGPHEYGFSNLVFSRPETIIIEIDHGLKDEQRSFFKKMAQIMNCNYYPFYVDLVEEENIEDDMYIDLKMFHSFGNKLNLW